LSSSAGVRVRSASSRAAPTSSGGGRTAAPFPPPCAPVEDVLAGEIRRAGRRPRCPRPRRRSGSRTNRGGWPARSDLFRAPDIECALALEIGPRGVRRAIGVFRRKETASGRSCRAARNRVCGAGFGVLRIAGGLESFQAGDGKLRLVVQHLLEVAARTSAHRRSRMKAPPSWSWMPLGHFASVRAAMSRASGFRARPVAQQEVVDRGRGIGRIAEAAQAHVEMRRKAKKPLSRIA